MAMDADFDLERLGDIPDVITPAERDASASPPRMAPRATAGPARASVQRQRAVALAVSLLWLTWQVFTLGLRTDMAKLGLAYPLAQVAVPALLGAVALGVALWPGREGLGAGVASLRAVTAVGLLAMVAITLFFPLPFAYAPPTLYGFLQWILICADIVAIMGVVPLALAAVVLRRSFVAAATERSTAVGAACGLGAVTAMHLHCENLEPAHMVLGHMVPAAVLAAAGALLLRYVTRV
jgi:hypothetical protein